MESVTKRVPVASEEWLSVFAHNQSTHSHAMDTFHSVIGCNPNTVHKIWTRYFGLENFAPLDLLWTLSFLYIYPKNDVFMAAFWGVQRETFFNKVWPCIHYLVDALNEVPDF